MEHPLDQMAETSPGLKSVPTIPEGIAYRIIEGEAVLINPETGIVFVLNQTGSFLWQQFDGTKSIREIAETVQQTFAVPYADAEYDLLEFLRELEARELIRCHPPNDYPPPIA